MTSLLTPTPTRGVATSGSPRRGARAWPYLTPVLALLLVWVYGPALFTGVLSFLEWNLTGAPGGFVGLDNYARLFREPEFGQAAGQTLLYAAALLPFSTIIPMFLAIMLWQRPGRASTVYRSLLFLPVMVAPVAVAVSWRFILNPLQGLANETIALVGLPPMNWLGDPASALIVIVIVTSAKVTAFNMLLYSAALSTLDRRTLEAARLERASAWETTRFVVIPQLNRTTVLLGLLSIVLAGQWVFTNVSVLTQGGPDGVTDNVYYRIYTLGFEFFETGMASAAAAIVLLFFGIASLGWVFLRRSRARG
ncbi:carbohydrate ABC transporter membrane protein 1 (CUT1 family) [Glaciihabitans tibetensis]|uniref:Carbohydrate ABC transporter membrane protein 1 (CUT1 family) n=1 Tax=Glaciihabitans tibetensis TaxID=1266600 RepID=A0A2T0V5H6_9MICO|nr:sugar ABC transporter permease [Glaciihabitans tibetensis]PRY65435.1 carbohydrate ABC transporter membrane protein 1 (CUT1 family) [Glaciihabitans tibetensis]